MNEETKQNDNLDCREVGKITYKDVLAIIVAEFQILFPIILAGVLIFGLLLYLLMKFWVKA